MVIEKVSSDFIWSVADLLRDYFHRGKYADVILPFTVLRRVDCVLEPTREKVMETSERYKTVVENLNPLLMQSSGYRFYNTSKFTFRELLGSPGDIGPNMRHYLNSFSENIREILEKFQFHHVITRLEEGNLLYLVVEKFAGIDLHPDQVSNHQMGMIFEDLIRRFNEMVDENPGEHFTPREIVRLMVHLVVAPDEEMIQQRGIIRTVYDPACGTGGMLTMAKEEILALNPQANVFLFGQEVNPETYAVARADMLIKGEDESRIRGGSTLSGDAFPEERFDYLLSNPPYGKEWKQDKDAVTQECQKGERGRFGAGLPRISDGQLLFLQAMIAKMIPAEEGSSRVAIVMNGSPLFTGDAGSGESEIRRWILENDWLEALIGLPDQMFYNTGIHTYIWVLANRKPPERQGKVQLIDARDLYAKMRRSLGDKRHELAPEHMEAIYRLYREFRECERSRIFRTTDFGYRKITVERPLRLRFQASEERLQRLQEQPAFKALAGSKKRHGDPRLIEIDEGKEQQEAILSALRRLDPDRVFLSRNAFEEALEDAFRAARLKVVPPIRKAILAALGEREEAAEICRDRDGTPEPDPEARDTENVPLGEDIREYFEREVLPHVPDAWINVNVRDEKDGKTGKVGYEINFNRYFYTYRPPRPLEEIEGEIKALEREILEMLREVAG